MSQSRTIKPDLCPQCGKDTSSSREHCIFCWAEFSPPRMLRWRNVYHAYNGVDALLAKSALESHGVRARIRDEFSSRMMLPGHGATVVQAAEGEHLRAQEVLRQVRGVRTDTEFLEWQAIKRRWSAGRRIAVGTLAALTALAACAAGVLLAATFRAQEWADVEERPLERPAKAR